MKTHLFVDCIVLVRTSIGIVIFGRPEYDLILSELKILTIEMYVLH